MAPPELSPALPSHPIRIFSSLFCIYFTLFTLLTPFANAEQTATQQAQAALFDDGLGMGNDGPGMVVDKPASDPKLTLENPFESSARKMSLIEKVAWGIAKALGPTLAVVGFAALAGPLLPVWGLVAGTVVIGAVVGSSLKFASDLRENKYQDPAARKPVELIQRDAIIQGVKEGIMAPFNLMLPGLFKPLGQLGTKVILQTAGKAAAINFVSGTLGNVGAGLSKNFYNNEFLRYREKISTIDQQLRELGGTRDPSGVQKIEIARLLTERETLAREAYGWRDFANETRQAGVSAALTGFAGGAAGMLLAKTGVAGRASMALFKDVAHAGQIGNAVAQIPFSYGAGWVNASLARESLRGEWEEVKNLRDASPKDSPFFHFYQAKCQKLEGDIAGIKSHKMAWDQMLSTLALNAGTIAAASAKKNFWDLPRETRANVTAKYRSTNPEWKKTGEIKAKIESLNSPTRDQFKTDGQFKSALEDFNRNKRQLVASFETQKTVALQSDGTAANKKLFDSIKTTTLADQKRHRALELARFLGEEDYLNATVQLMKKQGVEGSDQKLRQMARADLLNQYSAEMEAKTKILQDFSRKLHSTRGVESALVKPSAFRETLIDFRVAQLKSQGVPDKQIEMRMAEILRSADQTCMKQFGGTWKAMALWELRANSLETARFGDNGSQPGITAINKILLKIPQEFTQRFINHYKSSLTKQIFSGSLAPTINKTTVAQKDYLQQFLDNYSAEVQQESAGK